MIGAYAAATLTGFAFSWRVVLVLAATVPLLVLIERALLRRSLADGLGSMLVTWGVGMGPFHGVPIPIKELTQVDGQPAAYGSLGVSDAPRSGSEPVVTRLLDAGFLLMGRTNSP